MQNDPPFNNEPEDTQSAEEREQDTPPLLASSAGTLPYAPIKTTPFIENAPAPSETNQPQAESPAQETTLSQAQAAILPAQEDSVPTHAEPVTLPAQEDKVQPAVPAEQTSVSPLVQSAVSVPQTQATASPILPNRQATPAGQGPQPGAVPVTPLSVPPPGYVISQGYIVPQGYVVYQGYVVPQSYVQQQIVIPQPGYIPTTPQPTYIPQPGYVPPQAVTPPGYMPPQHMLPPGYNPPSGLAPRPPRPRLTHDKTSLLAIGGAILAVLVLLGIIVSVIGHEGGDNSTASATAPTISASPTTTRGQTTSAFQATGCPFEADPTLLQDQQLSCGYVTVPENRTVKNGPKVKLAVAIFKAQQYINSVDPDPVIRLDGGPGGPSLSGWAQAINTNNYRALIFNHDVVMFDQRGTGYSTPSLNCPELLSFQVASMGGGTAYEQAAHTCYNRLTTQGIDLSSFNSLENAADVADIIHALGYQQMTLYGVSYGTRLALTTMRLYPSVVHATVLDSVYPPNHNRADLTSDAQRVFTVLFQGCMKSSACNTKYPNLQSVFYTLVDQLNAHPISFYTVDSTTNQQYTVTFAGDDLISWVFTALYATSVIPSIPQVIYQVKQQNYFQLANWYSQISFDDTLSMGLFYSDECSEDWPFLTAQSIPQSEQGIEPHLAKVFGQEDEQQEYDICQFWKVNKAPDAQKQPVVSSIPTLITTGEYDPITPPANGQEAAKKLSNSYFFEFPGQGHGQLYSSSCSDQIISAFEDNPLVQPDGSCIGLMTEPQFL